MGTVRPWTLKLKIRVLLISLISANGGLDSWDPLIKGIGILRGIQFESQTTRIPNHQLYNHWLIISAAECYEFEWIIHWSVFFVCKRQQICLGDLSNRLETDGNLRGFPPSLGLEPYHGVKRSSFPLLDLFSSNQSWKKLPSPHRLPAKTTWKLMVAKRSSFLLGRSLNGLLSGAEILAVKLDFLGLPLTILT